MRRHSTPKCASPKRSYTFSERLDWSHALEALDDAANTLQDIAFENLFWEAHRTPPLVTRSTYSLVRSLSLRGNDVLSLLTLVHLPNLENLTLRLTWAGGDSNSDDFCFSSESLVQSDTFNSQAPSFEQTGIANHCFSLLVDCLKTRSRERSQKLHNLTVCHPSIDSSDIIHLLSNIDVRQIPNVAVGGFSGVFSCMSDFMTANPKAFALLGGKRGFGRDLRVWSDKFHETFAGWQDEEIFGETLLLYESGTGNVRWSDWPGGRKHRLIGSF